MVLDALFALHREVRSNTPHVMNAERVEFLCGEYGTPCPAWAAVYTVGNKKESKASAMRNQFFHEALFDHQPLGFGPLSITSDVTFEMSELGYKLLLGILDVTCAYRTKAVEPPGAAHGLDILRLYR